MTSTSGSFGFVFTFSFNCYEHFAHFCLENCFCSSSYKRFYKINTLFFLIGWAWEDLLSWTNTRARV